MGVEILGWKVSIYALAVDFSAFVFVDFATSEQVRWVTMQHPEVAVERYCQVTVAEVPRGCLACQGGHTVVLGCLQPHETGGRSVSDKTKP